MCDIYGISIDAMECRHPEIMLIFSVSPNDHKEKPSLIKSTSNVDTTSKVRLSALYSILVFGVRYPFSTLNCVWPHFIRCLCKLLFKIVMYFQMTSIGVFRMLFVNRFRCMDDHYPLKTAFSSASGFSEYSM